MTETTLHDFAPIPVRAALDPSLGTGALRVLILLTAHVNKQGTCFPSQGTLGRQLGISRQAVSQHIQKLKDHGYIRVERQNRSNGSETSCLYQILYAPLQFVLAGESPPCAPLQVLDLAPPASSRACTHNIPIEQTNSNKGSAGKGFQIPDWIPEQDWRDFEEMRCKKRKPMTDRARSLNINKLNDLRTQGYDPAAVIQQSILSGWDSFYPLKNQGGVANTQRKGIEKPRPTTEAYDEYLR